MLSSRNIGVLLAILRGEEGKSGYGGYCYWLSTIYLPLHDIRDHASKTGALGGV